MGTCSLPSGLVALLCTSPQTLIVPTQPQAAEALCFLLTQQEALRQGRDSSLKSGRLDPADRVEKVPEALG